MNEWTMQRVCTECGREFSLSDHGHAGAQAVAQALEQGIVDPEQTSDVVRNCPECLGGGQMNEQEAIVAAMRIEHEMTKTSRREQYLYLRLVGIVVAIAGFVALMLVRSYARLRQGQFESSGFWTLITIVLIIAGVGMFIIGYSQSSKNRT